MWHELVSMRFGLFDDQARFLPLFFCYWLIETALLGDRPYLYHVLRIMYFGLFLGSLIWLATPTLGIIVATSVTAVLVLQVFWAHIWAYSLGVTEQLAALGVAITIVGYRQVISEWVHDNPRGGRGILAVSIGTAIAIGSKENFLFLMVPLSVTLLAFYYKRTLNCGVMFKSLPFLTFSIFCLAAILCKSMTINVDYYGADSSLRHRINVVAAAWVFFDLCDNRIYHRIGSKLFRITKVAPRQKGLSFNKSSISFWDHNSLCIPNLGDLYL